MTTRTRIFTTIFVAGLLAVGASSAHANSGIAKQYPPAADAGAPPDGGATADGGAPPGADIETIGQIWMALQPNIYYAIEVEEPAVTGVQYPDVFLDVFSHPDGVFLGEGRPGYREGPEWVNAYVNVVGSSSLTRVVVVVRGRPGTPSQTQVPITVAATDPAKGYSVQRSSLGHFDIAPGPRIDVPGGLPAGSHVTTVEVPPGEGGTEDTVLLVLDDDVPIAFDDDSGVGRMSWLCTNPKPCPDGHCTILPARRSNQAARFGGTPLPAPRRGTTTVVWDIDIHWGRDSDHDGLGDSLESALQTDPNSPDTDGDGIQDGWEVLGIADSPIFKYLPGYVNQRKFPYYGADPKQQDLFTEIDWAANCPDTDPQCKPGHPLPPFRDKDAFQYTPTMARDYVRWFGTDLRVHADIGPSASTDNYTFGNWGGATVLADGISAEDDYYGHTACQGFLTCSSPSSCSGTRYSFFHHAISDVVGAGGGINWGLCTKFSLDPGISTHETGHFLGLAHWGRNEGDDVDVNCKPQYISTMNYAYTAHPYLAPGGHSPAFSHGRFLASDLDLLPDLVLNTTKMDEMAGMARLGVQPDSWVLDLLGTRFFFKIDADASSATYGAIDWDNDGVFHPGGTVKAFVNRIFDDRTGVRKSAGCDPEMTARGYHPLSAGTTGTLIRGGTGMKCYVGQEKSLYSASFPCTDTGADPCEHVYGWQKVGDASGPVANMTAAGDIVVYENANDHLLYYQGLSPTGAKVGGALGGGIVAGPPTAVVEPDYGTSHDGRIRVYAGVAGPLGLATFLRMWEYDPASDKWTTTAAVQYWEGTTAAAIQMVPGTAIGATRGYILDSSGLFPQHELLVAAIPSMDMTGTHTLELAVLKEGVKMVNGTVTVPCPAPGGCSSPYSFPALVTEWTRLPIDIWSWHGSYRSADIGRVGLTFRPEDPGVSSAPNAGRFYLTWQTNTADAPAFPWFSFTRGNSWPLDPKNPGAKPPTDPRDTKHGLVFLGDSVFYTTVKWPAGIVLAYAGGAVRGLTTSGAGNVYFPHADGIADIDQRDFNDSDFIQRNIACRLQQDQQVCPKKK